MTFKLARAALRGIARISGFVWGCDGPGWIPTPRRPLIVTAASLAGFFAANTYVTDRCQPLSKVTGNFTIGWNLQFPAESEAGLADDGEQCGDSSVVEDVLVDGVRRCFRKGPRKV
ncbi:unnamed protein product, partial [Mesorhabditis spiculigera]